MSEIPPLSEFHLLFFINPAIYHFQLKMETKFNKEEQEEGRGQRTRKMEKPPNAVPTPAPTTSTTFQEGEWSRTGRQKMEEPHHLAFPLLADVGGSHRDESETL